MPDNIHPGSFVGDSIEEFKKLPTWGKIAAVGVLVVVAFLAWRARQGVTAQQAAGVTASNPTQGMGTQSGSQSPFPMVGNLPVLPNNINPVFDSGGNPIAFQQGPSNGPSSGNPPTQSPNYTSGLFGLAAPVSTFNVKNPPSTYKAPNGVTYKLTYGNAGYNGQQRIWGTPTTGGQQVLLYGTTQPKAQGDGGNSGGMFAFMSDPLVYLVSAKPHVPSTVPQR